MSESKISFLNSLFSPNFQMVLPYLYILNISTFIPFIYELFTIHDKNKLILLEKNLLKKTFFLLFYSSMITRMIKNLLNKKNRDITIIYFSALVAILVISFTAWIYDCLMFFVFYGLLFSFCEKSKELKGNRKNYNS